MTANLVTPVVCAIMGNVRSAAEELQSSGKTAYQQRVFQETMGGGLFNFSIRYLSVLGEWRNFGKLYHLHQKFS